MPHLLHNTLIFRNNVIMLFSLGQWLRNRAGVHAQMAIVMLVACLVSITTGQLTDSAWPILAGFLITGGYLAGFTLAIPAHLYPLPIAFRAMARAGILVEGFSFLLALLSLVRDMLTLLMPALWMLWWLGYSILAISVTVKAWRTTHAAPVLKQLTVSTPHLPKGLTYKLVHISDLHAGFLRESKWLTPWIADINATQPDAIILTGDIVSHRAWNFTGVAEQLKKLTARHGKYAVSGNNDLACPEQFEEMLNCSNIQLLANQTVSLTGAIHLTGVHDSRHPDHPSSEKVAALLGTAPRGLNILASHRPIHVTEAATAHCTLVLAGHYHAGQYPPYDWFVKNVCPYGYGQHTIGPMTIYTTSGIGTWTIPLRLFTPAEIVEITLLGS